MGNSSQRESLNDKNYDGQDYTADQALRDGPLTNRKCTDVLFFLLFFVFFGGYGYTSYYGFKNGKPKELFRPVNGDGKLCGVDELADFPKLYYIIQTSGS